MKSTCIYVPIKPRGNTVFYVGVRCELNGKTFLVANAKSVTKDSQSVIVDRGRIKPTPANVTSILFQYYPNLEERNLRHPTDEEARAFIALYDTEERLVFDIAKTVSKTGQIKPWTAPDVLLTKSNADFMFDYFRTDFKQLFVEC
jgi:hypothetical protein